MSFKGNLKSFSLAEIFQSLTLNRHTGTLQITPDADNPDADRFIHFEKGMITFVSPMSPEGFHISEHLSRCGIISAELARKTAALRKENDEARIDTLLLEQGAASEEEIREALAVQIQEEIYDLFLLEKADFEFHINADPPYHKDPVQKALPVTIDPQSIMVEGMRRLDEWSVIRTRIQSFDEIFIPTGQEAEEINKEEAEVLALIDGRTPVHVLVQKVSFGRFLCSLSVFNLAKSGLIREADPEELAALAENSASAEEKICFLHNAMQQEPGNTGTRMKLIETYLSLDKHKQAVSLLEEGLDCDLPEQEAESLVKFFVKISPNNPKALKYHIDMLIREGNTVEAVKQTLSLANIFLHKERKEEAQEALRTISGHVPEDPRIQLSIAAKWKSCNDPASGIPFLESAAKYYEQEKNWKELNRVLKKIIEVEPNRPDVRYRLNQLAVKIETNHKTSHFKSFLIVACVCLTFTAVIIPWVYLNSAEKAFARSQKSVEILLKNNNFVKALNTCEAFKKEYSWSHFTHEVSKSIEHIKKQEKLYNKNLKQERLAAETRLDYIRNQPEIILANAKKEEKAGNLEETHRLLQSLKNQFPESPQAKSITYPLRLTSTPSGAEVSIQKKNSKKKAIGTTPLLIRYSAEQEISFFVNHTGCEPVMWKLPKNTIWEKHLKLKWSPLHQIRQNIPVFGRLTSAGDRIIFHSRNGKLYCFSPVEENRGWSRTTGSYGDPTSEFTVHDGRIYVGTVDGNLLCIEITTGRIVWHTRLSGAAHFKPLVYHENRTILAAVRSGTIYSLKEGNVLHKKKLDGTIRCSPALVDGILIAGTDTDFCMGLDPGELAPQWRTSLESDIAAGPFPFGKTAVVATQKNLLYQLHAKTGKILFKTPIPAPVSAPPCSAGNSVLYLPLTNGTMVKITENGKSLQKIQLSRSSLGQPFLFDGKLYTGDDFGHFYSFDLSTEKVKWSYSTPEPIASRACLFRNKIIISTKNGTFFVMKPLH
jgi:outer membrane protein assembly factor BamB